MFNAPAYFSSIVIIITKNFSTFTQNLHYPLSALRQRLQQRPKRNQSDPEEDPMEKRIGAILIIVKEKDHVQELNEILTRHAHVILGRQGIPVREKGISIISLVIEGTLDEINTLTGQLGRLEGLTAKVVLAKE